MKKNFILLLTILIAINAYGQVQTKRVKSGEFQGRGFLKVPIKKLPRIDKNKLLVEDKQDEILGLPPRFGKAFDLNLGFEDGVWEELESGRVWKLEIQSDGALSMNLIFNRFYLPNGAELYLYNSEKIMVIGPINQDQNNKAQVYATDLIKGSSIIIELYEPLEVIGESEIQIGKAVNGYKGISNFIGFEDSEDCNRDIVCSPEGDNWQDESDAVAMIIVNGTRWCTGTLINNACNDFTPNFLTAFHCLDLNLNGALSQGERDDVANWVFRFDYRSATCGGGDDFNYFTFSGSTFRSAWRDSDFALMELNQRPQANTGIQYAGWSRTAGAPTSSAAIHHPAGDVMKISIENQTATSTNWYVGTNDTHWEVDFDIGTVEPGSSGSPLFNQDERIVGQLQGGTTLDQFGNPVDRCIVTDGFYGRFDVSWNGGGTATTRLSTWLTNDPNIMQVNTIPIPSVSGPDFLCTTNTNYTITDVPAGQEVTWSVTPANLVVVSSGTGTTATIRAATSGIGDDATITFTLNGGGNCPNNAQFSRDFWVAKPTSVTGTLSGPSTVSVGSLNNYSVPDQWHYSGTFDWTTPLGHLQTAGGDGQNYVQTWIQSYAVNGYVQIWRTNTCGNGGARFKWVTVTGQGGCSRFCEMSIGPNPAFGSVTIQYLDKEGQPLAEGRFELDIKYTIKDLYGSIVLINRSNLTKLTLDLSPINKRGVYILEVAGENADEFKAYRLLIDR